ncbi:uncharacterized protein Pvf1 [Atheta coriaria]|uniref:uncharacterized protein Pvf1 n=1 Tax=Dalotia coriaria TaxID=877792 RepID=UPI0031F434BA
MMRCWTLVLFGLLVDGNPYSGHVADTDTDSISFPGAVHRRTIDISKSPKSNVTLGYNSLETIPPVEFIQKISTYNVSDLLLYYVDDYEDEAVVATRFGADVERSSAITPKPAPCIPELQTVKLAPENNDPSLIFIPACTRIERCGGCCSHNLLSCQPKDSEIVSFKLIKTQFASGNRLKYVGKEIVHMEKHTKCFCGCKVKATDCTAVQKYNEQECKCECANTDEEQKCHASSGKKLWDYTTCSCQCRNTSHCSTGFMFDSINCRCIPIPKRRHVLDQRPIEEAEKQKPVPFTFQATVDEDYDY